MAEPAYPPQGGRPSISSSRAAGPANPKQLEFIRALGLTPPEPCTLLQATETIVRAQNARFYAWKIARQELGEDLDGRALRPVILRILEDPARADEIVARMDEYMAEFLAAAEAHQGEHTLQGARTYAPELPADALYEYVREMLVEEFPHLPGQLTLEEPVSLEQEQAVFQRIRQELEPRFYVGRESERDRIRSYRFPLGLAAGVAILVAGGLFWRAKTHGPAAGGNATHGGARADPEETPAPAFVLKKGAHYRNADALHLYAAPRGENEETVVALDLPREGVFTVLDEQQAGGGTRWYRVDAADEALKPLGAWWINGSTLHADGLAKITDEDLAALMESQPVKPPAPPPDATPEPRP